LIDGNKDSYIDRKGMFNCPIVRAFGHRMLDEVADVLRPFMTAALKLQTKLRIAQNAITLGRNSLAEAQITSALAEAQMPSEVQAQTSISELMAASEVDPKFARVVSGKAVIQAADYDRAIAEYTEAIRIDPGYAFALANRGYAYSQKNELARAIADYTEA